MGKVRNNGAWTEGRYRSFITSTLRGGMRRWPPKWEALKDAALGRKTNKKTGKLAMHYKCACCAGEFTSNNIEVDHIEPVVAATGFESWDVYIDRLFCEKSNLQVLCKECHVLKTKGERISGTKTRVGKPRNVGAGVEKPTQIKKVAAKKPRKAKSSVKKVAGKQ